MIRLLALLTILFFLGAARSLIAQESGHSHPSVGDEAREPSPPGGLDEPGGASDTEASVLETELAALRQAIARYEDHANAAADGYKRFGKGLDDPLVGEHWYRPDLVGAPLDLEQPSTLLYQEIEGRLELVGVAYAFYQVPEEPLPDGFTGAGDVWHVHDMAAMVRALTARRPLLGKIAERRLERTGPGEGRTALVMLHAWPYGDSPAGAFAHYNRALPYRAAGLPEAYAEGVSEDAARGVALLLDDACGTEVARVDATARLEGDQEDALTAACEKAAARVDAARDQAAEGGDVAAEINLAAAAAWLSFQAAVGAALTPEQQARIEVLRATTRHGPG